MKRSFFPAVLLAAVVFTAAPQLSAKTQSLGFTLGNVVAGELTNLPQEIIDSEKFPHPCNFKKPLYVLVSLKMHPRRSISIFDYQLVINRVSAPCISAMGNDGAFVFSTSTVYPGDKDIARLLFVFDGARVAAPGAGKTLRAVLTPLISGRSSVTLNLTDMGGKPFTSADKIPAEGLLK